jgi:hypothetical protein
MPVFIVKNNFLCPCFHMNESCSSNAADHLKLSTLFTLCIMLTGCITWPGTLDPDQLLDLEAMKPRGTFYDATVPATLDLAERGRLSINVLTRNVEPDTFYGVYQTVNLLQKKFERKSLTWNILPKHTRTLPMLRAMNGSDDNLEVELNMLRAMLNEVDDNGQMYYPFDGESPPMGTSYPQTNAQLIFTMFNNYARDGNREWLKWINRVALGLHDSVIHVEDRAFYPMQSGIDRDGEWHFMHHEGEITIPYTPPDEPESDQQGLEGAAKSDQVRAISALVKHYNLTGNRDSLDLAERVYNFCMKPGMWMDTSDQGYPGNEHGQWGGHIHNNCQCMMAFLDLASTSNNNWLRQFVREAYDHGRRYGVIRMGWMPMWTRPMKYNRPSGLLNVTEPCALADMVLVAVKLSDAGLGDYWDDVDAIIRNHLIAQQVVDRDRCMEITGARPGSEHARMIEDYLGGFAIGSPTHFEWYMPACCTVNGAQGIYYAWHGITRFDDGVATVNLFLNRASDWMDIDSYLPYEGKVVMHNKQAHTAMIRIPGWLGNEPVETYMNNRLVNPPQAGRYLVIQDLEAGDEIRLEFEVLERRDTHQLAGGTYKVDFRGSTVVDIAPRPEGTDKYQLYQRDHMKRKRAPMRKVRRFVADKSIPLGTY